MTRTNRRRRPGDKSYFVTLGSLRVDVSTHVMMICQDIGDFVLPIGGRSRNWPQFKIEISGTDATSGIDFIAPERARGESTEYAICEVVKEIAQSMCWFGRAVYEIHQGEDGRARIVFVSPRQIWKLPFFYLQFGRDYSRNLTVRFVGASKVWSPKLPKLLSRSLLPHSIAMKLVSLTDLVTPKFYLNDLSKGSNVLDFGVFQKFREAFILKSTAKYSWNQRGYTQLASDAYNLHRSIKMNEARALLRESIVGELNRLFLRMGINANIVVSGIPSSRDLHKLAEDFLAGELPMKDLQKQFRL